mgnify:CR=1 FL=1
MKNQDLKKSASSTARLAAVQVLYESDLVGGAVEDILASFKEKRWSSIQEELKSELMEVSGLVWNLPTPNRRIMAGVVRGVVKNRPELDQKIVVYMDTDGAFEQLEMIAKAILRAAAFELLYAPQVPIGVISSDYVSIANAFFTENQPKLINAVIDAFANQARHVSSMAKHAHSCSSV